MSVGIDELFDMLSWNSDEETQKKGIELAKKVKCYSVFLQPFGYGKYVWENCAKILAEYPDERLDYYSKDLLIWLMDMNWPGAEIIFQRLLKLKKTDILSGSIAYRVRLSLIHI